MSPPPPSSDAETSRAGDEQRVRGRCTVMFAFDIGYGIDLEAARAAVGGEFAAPVAGEAPTPRRGVAPPRPLRVHRAAPPVEVSGAGSRWVTTPEASVSLFDFGAASVAMRFEIDEPLEGLVGLSTALYSNAALVAAARAVAEQTQAALGGAVASPEPLTHVEDYVVYEVTRPPGAMDASAWVTQAGPTLARALRAEASTLSNDETTEALAARLSYGPGDAALVDWNAALLVAPAPSRGLDDELGVLEYTNVELLEMRVLDDRLDAALDAAFAAAQRGRWWAEAADLATVAKLQVEAALMFEAVNNAAKLIGDQYLSRLYRASARRLHLGEWDAAILRKLQTLESIYEKMNDRRANRRMEILEWIIIVLIAAEIVMSLVPSRGW